DRIDFVRQGEGEPDGVPRDPVEPPYGDHDDRPLEMGHVKRPVGSGLVLHASLPPPYPQEEENEGGDDDDGEPGPLGELGNGNDEEGCSGRACAETIEDEAPHGVAFAGLKPVEDHPQLRKGEGKECPDREEGYEPVRPSAEAHKKRPRQDGEYHDAVAVNETSPAMGKARG